MKKLIASTGLLAASISASLPAHAVETAVGFTLSTFGPGVELTVGVNEYISVRGFFSSMTIDLDDYVDELSAVETNTTSTSADFELGAIGALFDYHPFAGKFRLTAGLLQNNNELKARASVVNEPIGNGATAAQCQLGIAPPGNCYTGDLTLGVDMGGTVPYIGLGFGSAASEGSPFGFGVEVGVVPMNVDVDYKLVDNTGGISQAVINQEINEIEKDTDEFKLFPMLKASVSYRF